MDIIIFGLAIFFAINMGASSFAASMATAVGSKALSKQKAQFLYIGLIVLGAVLFGKEVSATLSKGIIPSNLIDIRSLIIILLSASFSLFSANLMKIPQSTSLSTIAAICGVGFFYHQVKWSKIEYLAICWVISTVVSFILIYAGTRLVYPPRKINFWIYEKIVQHKQRLTLFVVLTSCYNVFSQGTNNVANVVGPLVAAGKMETMSGLMIMGCIFALGAFVFSGPMTTTSEKIVPLGLLTATIINFVSATVTLIASIAGIPQPAVIIYTMAVFAIGSIKDGPDLVFANPITKKTFYTWCINPLLTFFVSWILSILFLQKG